LVLNLLWQTRGVKNTDRKVLCLTTPSTLSTASRHPVEKLTSTVLKRSAERPLSIAKNKTKRSKAKSALRPPDLEQSNNTVLNSLAVATS
jgi:hypothetical protein